MGIEVLAILGGSFVLGCMARGAVEYGKRNPVAEGSHEGYIKEPSLVVGAVAEVIAEQLPQDSRTGARTVVVNTLYILIIAANVLALIEVLKK